MKISNFKYILTNIGGGWGTIYQFLGITPDGDVYSTKKFNDNKTKIRANQGHSIKKLVMNFKEVETPPEYLYHGTSKKNFEMIKESCELLPMSRQMVHLSGDIETASKVGKRHRDLIVLQINTCRLLDLNHKIYISDNGVYLVDSEPLSCIELNI